MLCVCHIVFYFIVTISQMYTEAHLHCKNIVKMQMQKCICIFPADVEHNFTFAFSTIAFVCVCCVCAHIIFVLENRTKQSVFKLHNNTNTSRRNGEKSAYKHVKFNLHVSICVFIALYSNIIISDQQFICIFAYFHSILPVLCSLLLLNCIQLFMVLNGHQIIDDSSTHLRFVV